MDGAENLNKKRAVNNMKHARIINNVAIDVVDGDPADFFHSSIASQFVTVLDEVESGWLLDTETEEWSAPEPLAPAQVAATPQKIDVISFKLLFTSPERIKAKELRATDPVIDDFWSILDDQRTQNVDMALTSIQQAIMYTLNAIDAAGLETDVAARTAAILSGRVT